MQISTITTLSLLLTPCITSPLQRSSQIRWMPHSIGSRKKGLNNLIHFETRSWQYGVMDNGFNNIKLGINLRDPLFTQSWDPFLNQQNIEGIKFSNQILSQSTLYDLKNVVSHVLAHLLKSFRAYNVKSSSTLFSDNILWMCEISFPCARFNNQHSYN